MFDALLGMLPQDATQNPMGLIDRIPELLPLAENWVNMHKQASEDEVLFILTLEKDAEGNTCPMFRMLASTIVDTTDGKKAMTYRMINEWPLLPLLDSLKTMTENGEENEEPESQQ